MTILIAPGAKEAQDDETKERCCEAEENRGDEEDQEQGRFHVFAGQRRLGERRS